VLRLLPLVTLAGVASAADPVDPVVRSAEAARVAVIDKVRPAVVAVCKFGGEASGSGVLIDADGYALTNFHVVEDTGPVMQCGLPDGRLYDGVVVGTDIVGDVALIKLLPREPGRPFPFVPLGDSDAVRAGEWSLAMGNPFGIARDFTPSVTFGLVSGTHRYQPPAANGVLEYTDCLQIDTSINPGNSGGPLFNLTGELIGINGRGQFDKRMRINSGAGFAISINQIKHFLGHLRAGLNADHATLGAVVTSESEDGDLAKLVVRQVLEDSDAHRRGLRLGDHLLGFAGRPLTSTNHYKNVLGIYPKGWRLPLEYRRGGQRRQVLVRLMGNIDTPLDEAPRRPQKGPKKDADEAELPADAKKSPAAKLFVPKPGFANAHFNELERNRVLGTLHKAAGDPAGLTGAWTVEGSVKLADRQGDFKLTIGEAADGLTEAKLARSGIVDAVKPLKPDAPLGELQLPTGSGGLLTAVVQYRRLLGLGEKGFEAGFAHGGYAPCYPTEEFGSRVDCEVLRTKHGPFESVWFFDRKDGGLIGCEAMVSRDEDPCELYFGDYKEAAGRRLPHRIEVRTGDRRYAVLTVKSYTFGPPAGKP
jgi:S1-C subfamily serine protease